jgi:hypothetical protein
VAFKYECHCCYSCPMRLPSRPKSRRARIHVSSVLIALLLHAVLSPLSAANATGRFERYCDGIWFFLNNVDGLPTSTQLVVFLHMSGPPYGLPTPEETWFDVYVSHKGCRADGSKCQPLSQGRLWLNKGASDGKRISGKYELDLDGRHLQGQFVAKERKQTSARICE